MCRRVISIAGAFFIVFVALVVIGTLLRPITEKAATETAQAIAALPTSASLPTATDAPTVAQPTQTDVPGSVVTIDPVILATQAFFTKQQTQAAAGQSV